MRSADGGRGASGVECDSGDEEDLAPLRCWDCNVNFTSRHYLYQHLLHHVRQPLVQLERLPAASGAGLRLVLKTSGSPDCYRVVSPAHSSSGSSPTYAPIADVDPLADFDLKDGLVKAEPLKVEAPKAEPVKAEPGDEAAFGAAAIALPPPPPSAGTAAPLVPKLEEEEEEERGKKAGRDLEEEDEEEEEEEEARVSFSPNLADGVAPAAADDDEDEEAPAGGDTAAVATTATGGPAHGDYGGGAAVPGGEPTPPPEPSPDYPKIRIKTTGLLKDEPTPTAPTERLTITEITDDNPTGDPALAPGSNGGGANMWTTPSLEDPLKLPTDSDDNILSLFNNNERAKDLGFSTSENEFISLDRFDERNRGALQLYNPSSSAVVPSHQSNPLDTLAGLPMQALAQQVQRLQPSGQGQGGLHQQNVLINIQQYTGPPPPQHQQHQPPPPPHGYPPPPPPQHGMYGHYGPPPPHQPMHQPYQYQPPGMYYPPAPGYPPQPMAPPHPQQMLGQPPPQQALPPPGPVGLAGGPPPPQQQQPHQQQPQAIGGPPQRPAAPPQPYRQAGPRGAVGPPGGPRGAGPARGGAGAPPGPRGGPAPRVGGPPQRPRAPMVRPRGAGMTPMRGMRPRMAGPQNGIRAQQPNQSPTKRTPDQIQSLQAKKKRLDVLTPSDKDDDDCQVICMQPKNTDGGLPQIESVQGGTSEPAESSIMHLSDSITLSVRNPPPKPAPAAPQKAEAKAVANILATRGITVTATPKGKNDSPQKSPSSSPVPSALSLNGAVSIVAAKANGGGKQSPDALPTVDLTDDAPASPKSGRPGLPYRCDLCPAQYPNAAGLSKHRQTYHKTTHGLCELGIPLINLKQPGVMQRLGALGINNYIPLPPAGPDGTYALPIISTRNPGNVSGLGATQMLSLGPVRTIPKPQQQQAGGQNASPMKK